MKSIKQSTETETVLYSTRTTHKKGQENVKSRCGKTGYFVAKCRNKASNEYKEENNSFYKVFATPMSGKSKEWYLDSAASTHMIGWASCLKGMKKCDKTIMASWSTKGRSPRNSKSQRSHGKRHRQNRPC